MNVIHLIADASLVAQIVLLILVILLYLAVWFIIRKRWVLKDYIDKCNQFEKEFWAGGDIGVLEERVRSNEFGEYGLAHIFLLGQEEFKKACETGGDNIELILEGVRRALDISIQNEETRLNRYMQFLATVASVSPYIGLFGTVWGIIIAFQSIAQSSQATIASVAPGIAEALIATAMALLSAIPALIAYNYFSSQLEILSARFDNFANHYLNILHRNL